MEMEKTEKDGKRKMEDKTNDQKDGVRATEGEREIKKKKFQELERK